MQFFLNSPILTVSTYMDENKRRKGKEGYGGGASIYLVFRSLNFDFIKVLK